MPAPATRRMTWPGPTGRGRDSRRLSTGRCHRRDGLAHRPHLRLLPRSGATRSTSPSPRSSKASQSPPRPATQTSPLGRTTERHLISVQSVVIDPERPPLGRRRRQRRSSARPRPGGQNWPASTWRRQGLRIVRSLRRSSCRRATSTTSRFDLRRGEAGFAFLTDSSDKGRRDHRRRARLGPELASAARPPRRPRPTGDARPGGEQAGDGVSPPGGPPKPVTMGSDGIAGEASTVLGLFYCPLVEPSPLRSVDVDALVDDRVPTPRWRRRSWTSARRGRPTAWS